MIYTLLIQSSPYHRAAADSAWHFADALLQSGHSIYRVFFYSEGVHTANSNSVAAQDEWDVPEAWQTLIQNHQIDAVTCISAALKRGILNTTEAARYGKTAVNLREPYDLSGLGQLIEAALQSDKLITFA